MSPSGLARVNREPLRNRFCCGALNAVMNMRLPCLVLLSASFTLHAADWPRFRGPNGSGIAPDDKPVPVEWSATKNMKWQTALPGPGSSSPIVVGDRVFVTCWSGYATEGQQGTGDITALKRHLVCVDRATGKILWDQSVPAKQPEERYGGMFAQNGYASHTPVSDGKSVFAFFGKSGVHAFDLEGKPLWQADVGDWDDRRGWGTASSPILHGDVLIVPAFVESQAMYGFDKTTGKQLWKAPSEGFASTWGTPIVVEVEGRADLVIAVPGEVWGFNPDTGKLRWYATGLQSDSVCNSVVTDGSAVFAMSERGGGSVAIKAGGKGDVSATHTLWTGANGSRSPPPCCMKAASTGSVAPSPPAAMPRPASKSTASASNPLVAAPPLLPHLRAAVRASEVEAADAVAVVAAWAAETTLPPSSPTATCIMSAVAAKSSSSNSAPHSNSSPATKSKATPPITAPLRPLAMGSCF